MTLRLLGLRENEAGKSLNSTKYKPDDIFMNMDCSVRISVKFFWIENHLM